MKVGIIGTGFIADVHAEILLGLGHMVSIVIGSNLKSAEEFAARWNIPCFSSNLEDLDTTNIDAVHICTPPALHFSETMKCLGFGKHVVCEKPLCLDPAEALEICKVSQEKKLAVGVNYNVRYHSLLADARKIIKSSDFGEIFLVHGSYLQEFHALPDAYSWRYQSGLSGNMRAVTEIGSHMIDLIRFLTDLEITAVSASFGYAGKNRRLENGLMYPAMKDEAGDVVVTTEDAAIVSLKFNNGSIGNVVLSEVSHGRSNCMSIDITGTKQSVWWNSEAPFQLHRAQKGIGIQTQSDAFGNSFSDTIKACIKSFYNNLSGGTLPEAVRYPTSIDGYRNVAVCHAIFCSATNDSRWATVDYENL